VRAFFRSFPPLLLPLIFISMTGHMALSGGRLAGSLFTLKSGSPEYVVGVFMALFSIIPVFTSVSIGRWVDRAGASRAMRAGIALVLGGAWLPVAFLSVPSLLITAIMIGCGFSVLSVATQHTVGHLVDGASASKRLANFGWYAMGHSMSSTFGPLIAGVMIDAFNFRAAFATLAMFTCASAWLVYFRTRGLRGATPTARSTAADGVNAKTPHILDLLASSEMRRIYWVNMVMSASWDLFIVMLPVFGVRQGFSASVIGTVFSLFAFGTFVSRSLMPWLSRRATEWQIVRVAVIVITAIFLLLPWAHVAPLLMTFGFVFGCAVGLSQPNMLSLVHAAAPAGRGGEAVGLRSVIGNSCSVAVPLAFGAAVAPFGIAPLLIGGGSFFSSAVPVAHASVKSQRRLDERTFKTSADAPAPLAWTRPQALRLPTTRNVPTNEAKDPETVWSAPVRPTVRRSLRRRACQKRNVWSVIGG
jgi:MFS family permease